MDIAFLVLTPLFAAGGFMFRLFIDKMAEHKAMLREKNIKAAEHKLSKFYIPLYTNLNAELLVNRQFVFLKGDLLFEVESFVQAAHAENQQIIRSYMVEVNPKVELQTLLTQYNDHITLYLLSQKMQQRTTTCLLAKQTVPYPKQLLTTIEAEISLLRMELDALHNSVV